ncbi:MAG: glycogen debranching enzyme family protein [Armatimonadetes bacterium]|nr:glycogen debranching enzyme family protein [Armatimonadota bacterium]
MGANQYSDTLHPQGFLDLVGFRLDPWPTWTWQVDEARLEKQVLMLHGAATTVVVYRLLEAAGPVGLELRPLIAGRDRHDPSFENWSFRRQVESSRGLLRMAPYGPGSEVALSFPGGNFQVDGFWFYNFVYSRETERGLDDREDLFNPGVVLFTLHPGETARVGVGVAEVTAEQLAGAEEVERARRAALLAVSPLPPAPLRDRLLGAAAAFRVREGAAAGVVAGYPWFGERRRDALIGLPGLFLASGRAEPARQVLAAAAASLPADLAAGLAGVDEPGWLAWAADAYQRATGDERLVAEHVAPALAEMVRACGQGECAGLARAADGLIAHQGTGRPRTWMNAQLGNWVVTPRTGKAVEVNALWHFLLRRLAEWTGDAAAGAAAATLCDAFRARFPSPAGGLYDVVDTPNGDDAGVRPNQVLAVALDRDLLPDELAAQVVSVVTDRLLTPYGLRTLAPGDPRFRGIYAGGAAERDEAYHQGPAWPWLLAPYAAALMRCHPDGRAEALALLEPFAAHLDEYGLGQVAELFDGVAPHTPRGSLAHAVSLAALLEIGWRAAGTG